ncbi:hypothetical protein [Cupriavidus basilensis]|uniref:hypothetical protein n=1 Tax=Cupriavidus basilensis TaxID=68895 RepID=UPI0020A67D73|nr:hypothetical protein [Cupriavidus basilensis]MCP3024535.1 hypothetical protein [Cupriavidus basilensis]
MANRVVLISIHPEFTERIIAYTKNIEFRRLWPNQKIDFLVIYATSPVMKIVAIVRVKNVTRASKTRLWEVGKKEGAGISRRRLFEYMSDRTEGVGILLGDRVALQPALEPNDIFGPKFVPPQSFRYVQPEEKKRLLTCLE